MSFVFVTSESMKARNLLSATEPMMVSLFLMSMYFSGLAAGGGVVERLSVTPCDVFAVSVSRVAGIFSAGDFFVRDKVSSRLRVVFTGRELPILLFFSAGGRRAFPESAAAVVVVAALLDAGMFFEGAVITAAGWAGILEVSQYVLLAGVKKKDALSSWMNKR